MVVTHLVGEFVGSIHEIVDERLQGSLTVDPVEVLESDTLPPGAVRLEGGIVLHADFIALAADHDGLGSERSLLLRTSHSEVSLASRWEEHTPVLTLYQMMLLLDVRVR
jgi:hypothetical protein